VVQIEQLIRCQRVCVHLQTVITEVNVTVYIQCRRLVTFTLEYVPNNCFITRFRAAVSVVVGRCCPALLNCIDVDAYTVVLLGEKDDDNSPSEVWNEVNRRYGVEQVQNTCADRVGDAPW